MTGSRTLSTIRGVALIAPVWAGLLLGGCAGRSPASVPVVAVSAAHAGPDEAGQAPAPTFEKVPPEENIVLVDPAAAGEASRSAQYLLEIEDVIEISIYGEEDLQHVEVPVRPDGRISFAFVGDLDAAGRSVEEVRAELTSKLRQYLRSPQVTIIAKEFAQKRIFVGGEVRTPGILHLTGREGTLMDALYKVGLTTEKAHLEGAYIMRANKVVAADFKGLVRGDLTRNVRLMDQDVIFVPENVRRSVYVLGEVNLQSALPIGEPIPIIEVLARAGGFKTYAKKREVAVIRGGLKSPEVAIVDGRRLIEGDFRQNIMVMPGDIVYVATSALGKYNSFIDAVLRSLAPFVQGVVISNTANP